MSDSQNFNPSDKKFFPSENDVYSSKPVTADEEEARKAFRYRTFRCPCCQTAFSVTKDDVGKKIICPDCGTEVTVPSWLDFDTETDYERLYLNREKQERDRVFSPVRNPNREGISVEQNQVYSLHDSNQTSTSNGKEETYYPVRCRVCETLIQAPSFMLGKTVICPDCGTEIVVTDAFKKQQETVDVRFDPTDRGVYDIGEVPKKPVVAFQFNNGKTVMIDPNQKSIAPNRNGQLQDSLVEDVVEQKKETNEISSVETSKNKGSVNGKNPKLAAQERVEQLLRERSKERSLVNFFKKRSEKKRQKLENEENLTQYLPPMRLRHKNGELVWALPSPPKRLPLFNRTFQAVVSEEIWTRGALIAILTVGLGCLLHYFIIQGSRDSFAGVRGFGQFISLVGWIFTCPIVVTLSAMLGMFFWSVYNAGNSGAKRVVEWRSEDLLGFFGFGLWFAGMLAAAVVPGSVVSLFLGDETNLPLKALAYCCSFWVFFPVFWLSTMQSGYLFWPITTNVFKSFFTKIHLWFQFYLTIAVYFFVPCVGWLLCVGTKLFWILAPIFATLIPIFFGLLLGRLSWILDDVIRSEDFDD